ncbi:putative transcription accessory protein [Escherichia coli]|uniref:Putative transcription accessory protein n=1 Tax=Escherichia coli TaxID=562 RepID=A0A2X1MV19_ECOLX|nr:putative transcription accessory protein [Escherichia coli]
MAAPAGLRATMGLDPGLRTGGKSGGGRCHWQTGGDRHHLPAHRTGRKSSDDRCCAVVKNITFELVAIGNGTASAKLSVSISMCRSIPESDRAESNRQRSRRVGLLGFRAGCTGVPGSRRFAAWRGVYRPPFAGSAGGAGENRSEIYRRRSVSA